MDWSASWKYTCYECNRPLCVYFTLGEAVDKYDFVVSLFTFRTFKPIQSHGQLFFYKFYGLKARRVCYCCFKGIFRPSFTQLKKREIGKKIMYCNKRDELKVFYEWLKDFDRFFRRTDKHLYMLENL